MQRITIRRAAVVGAGAVAVQALVLTPPVNDGGVLYPIIVLLAPLASGIVAESIGRSWRPVAVSWALAGIVMFIDDWLLATGNQGFHLLLAILMATLTALGAGVARLTHRSHHAMDATLDR